MAKLPGPSLPFPEDLARGRLGKDTNPAALALEEAWAAVKRAKERIRKIEAQLEKAREAEAAAIERYRQCVEAAKRLRDSGELSDALMPACDAAVRQALAKDRRREVDRASTDALRDAIAPFGWEVHQKRADESFIYVTVRQRRQKALTEETVRKRIKTAVSNPTLPPGQIADEVLFRASQQVARRPDWIPNLQLPPPPALAAEGRMPNGP